MSYRTPCCGFATVDDRDVIAWNPYSNQVQCKNCGATYRLSNAIENNEAFKLLALAEQMAQISEKLEVRLGTSAVVNNLEACIASLDAHEEEAARILKDAIDVLEDLWPDRRT